MFTANSKDKLYWESGEYNIRYNISAHKAKLMASVSSSILWQHVCTNSAITWNPETMEKKKMRICVVLRTSITANDSQCVNNALGLQDQAELQTVI